MIDKYDLKNINLIKALKEKLKNSFFCNYQRRLNKLSTGSKNYNAFELQNKEWLDTHFHFIYNDNSGTPENIRITPGKYKLFDNYIELDIVHIS